MPVPDYQLLMLPTLKALADGTGTSISELRARVAAAEGLTPEDVSQMFASGHRQPVFANRVGWALLGLDRYVQEFAGRHNLRDENTLTQMGVVVRGLEGKRFTYTALKQPNGLPSGARA